jgi:hypothetical protein
MLQGLAMLMMGCMTSATTNRQGKSRRSAKLRSERQPFVCVDGGNVSCTQVLVGTFLALRDVLAGAHAEIRTRVEQELLLADFVHYE